jgi:Fe-S cluster assembly protein SufD
MAERMNARANPDLAALIGAWTRPSPNWFEAAVVRDRALRNWGTPATRELWKYTPINAMVEAFRQLPAASDARWTGLDQPGVRAVAFNALARDDRDLVNGVLEGGLDADRHVLADLALLRAADGLLIDVTATPEQPIELARVAAGITVVVLVVRPEAAVTLVERQSASAFSAQLLLADIGRHARLEHHRGAFPDGAGSWSLTQARVHEGGSYQLTQQALGGARTRLETHVLLSGRGASAELTGAYLTGDGHHLDQQNTVEHEAPDTVSRQRFHGIGVGKGRSAFNGRIHIHPRAARSDAWLSNRNLALHADAEMNTKPELEIYTDDVRCAHGATVGQLAADSLFFLTARGIPEPAARTMLAHAFLRECISGPLADEGTERLLGAIR